MDTQKQKTELLDWLSKVDDPTLLHKLFKVKEESIIPNYDDEIDYTLDNEKIQSLRRLSDWWENMI